MKYCEIFIFINGLIYVLLIAWHLRSGWLFGILSSAAQVYVSFQTKLYLDSGLNIFYIVMGIVGYLKWNNSQGELFSKKLNLSQWGFYLCVGTSLSFLMGYVFKWIGNVSPYVDGFTAVFSVIATWLTIQKFSDNWLIWIVINLLLTYMFFMQGLKINASLFFVYFILSFFGWLKWKKT